MNKMSQTVELSGETYERLVQLAQRQSKTPEEVIQEVLLSYQNEEYRRANERMLAQGVLASLPTPTPGGEDDFEPEVISGQPLSEMVIEGRR